MATDIAACGAYLAVGQLLRHSGLIQDSDTQARRHAHAATAWHAVYHFGVL